MQDTLLASRFGRLVGWLQIAALVVATLLPALIITNQATAAQLEERSIDLSTSEASASGATYSVSFNVTTDGSDLNGLVVQFCADSPIIGVSCDTTTGDIPDIGASPAIANQSGANFTVDGTNSDNATGTLVLTGTNTAVSTGTTVSFDITGVTNPDTANTSFYARIVTYETAGGAQAYSVGTPGTHIDDGGIAMSTAEQLTVTARVQERLEFCVGDRPAGDPTAANCTEVDGNDVDLGVLSPSSANFASINPSTDTDIGEALLSTNAFNGATVQYFATELKVAGETCDGTNTDQCINEKSLAGAISTAASDEEWGMSITDVVDQSSGATGEELVAETDYDGTYHIATDTSTPLAQSTSIVDNDVLELDFGATAHTTTPTGVYQSTLTFVATGTF